MARTRVVSWILSATALAGLGVALIAPPASAQQPAVTATPAATRPAGQAQPAATAAAPAPQATPQAQGQAQPAPSPTAEAQAQATATPAPAAPQGKTLTKEEWGKRVPVAVIALLIIVVVDALFISRAVKNLGEQRLRGVRRSGGHL
ncbi:MAG: hypothetical protein U0531_05945 [Dehalococcoidia bacterium]